MKKNILFFCLILNLSLVYSQDANNLMYKKIYEISFSEFPRNIELIENKDGNFEGAIITKFSVGNKSKTYIDKKIISPTLVKELIPVLEKSGIEIIKNCDENNDCIRFLDGDVVGFKINANNLIRNYYFDSLYSSTIIDDNTPLNRKQAKKILVILEEYLKLKEEETNLKKRLPSGKYGYFRGSSIYSFIIQ